MQARRARVRQIRNTVTAAAVAVFIVLFATIYIQMAVGKDPALGSSTTAQVGAQSWPAVLVTNDDEDEDDDSSSGTMTTAQS